MKQLIVFGIIAMSVAGALGQQDKLPPPFPRTNATQLLDTDRIRVWNIVWPKGQPTALHRHIYDQVGTYYAPGGRKITQPDGEARTNFTEVGSLSTTKRGTTHIEEGTTDPPLRAVFIEMKQDGPSGLAPVDTGSAAAFPREGAKQLQNDERVTVWDTTWTPGAQGFRYRAARETVIVFLGDGTLQVSPAHGAMTTAAVHAGTMRHLPRGDDASLEIVTGSPRAMFFEFK